MKLNAAQIDHITTEERIGLDLIHLKDGRVVGINDECLCIYTSADAFWDGETSKQTIYFEDLSGGAE